MSKPVSPRTIWWTGIAGWVGSFTMYVKFTPIMDLTVLIVYIAIMLFWIWLPILILHWYVWDKGKRDG